MLAACSEFNCYHNLVVIHSQGHNFHSFSRRAIPLPDSPLQDLGNRPSYDVEDLSAPRLNEFTYGILMKALQLWPLNKLILWKIKLDAGFSIVEKLAAHLNSVPLHLPTTLPTGEEIAAADKASAEFDLESFILNVGKHQICTLRKFFSKK
jgi:hypothetical protein